MDLERNGSNRLAILFTARLNEGAFTLENHFCGSSFLHFQGRFFRLCLIIDEVVPSLLLSVGHKEDLYS